MAGNLIRVSKFTSAFAVTSTQLLTDPIDNTSSGGIVVGLPGLSSGSVAVRIAVDKGGSNDARLVTYGGGSMQTSAPGFQGSSVRLYAITVSNSDGAITPAAQVANAYEHSQPLFNTKNGRYYLSLVLVNNANWGHTTGSVTQTEPTFSAVADALVVVDISLFDRAFSIHTPVRLRPAAVLGDYSVAASAMEYFGLGLQVISNKSTSSQINLCPHRPGILNDTVSFGYGKVGPLSTRSYEIGNLTLWDPSVMTFSTDVHSGGHVGQYDNWRASCIGFYQTPSLTVEDAGAGSGTPGVGTRGYLVVYIFKDHKGNIHYSRASQPVLYAGIAAHATRVVFSLPTVCSFDGEVQAAIFRTQPGGTAYNLLDTVVLFDNVSPVTVSIEKSVFLYTDNAVSDATCAAAPLLYRQPGTVGTPLDRYPPLAASHIVRHKDRVFYCNGSVVYYSGFAVDGEAPWFNPAFSIQVPGGTGSITGLASMDGLLVVFKKNAIWVIDGDGPPDNGGTGTEFSTPRRIHTEYGCIDPRSIVSIPKGTMYISSRGIELLDRGLQVTWIGERVSKTLSQFPFSAGSTFDRTTSRVHFCLASAMDATYPHIFDRTNATNSGCVVVYDIVNNAWTTSKYYEESSVDSSKVNRTVQDVCFVYGANASGQGIAATFMAGGHSNGKMLSYEDYNSGLDNGSFFVSCKARTGWVRGPSAQDRILSTDITILADRLSGTNLRGQYYWNYDTTNLLAVNLFDSTATNTVPVQVRFQSPRPESQAVSFVISTETPTNPTTVGSGRQLDINAVTVRLGLKGGGFKLPSAQKG